MTGSGRVGEHEWTSAESLGLTYEVNSVLSLTRLASSMNERDTWIRQGPEVLFAGDAASFRLKL